MTRPYVILNAAMSLDGKISTREGDSRISSPEDLERVHDLRQGVDAVMVGINTILKDDPILTNRSGGNKIPLRVVVDSMARTPTDAKVVMTVREIDTLVAVTTKAPDSRIKLLRKLGINILISGRNNMVDLSFLLRHLSEIGVEKLLLEGGGTLNWSMLSQGLVDEIYVAISPMIFGGDKATTLVGGLGFPTIENAIHVNLKKIETHGENIVLFFKVIP